MKIGIAILALHSVAILACSVGAVIQSFSNPKIAWLPSFGTLGTISFFGSFLGSLILRATFWAKANDLRLRHRKRPGSAQVESARRRMRIMLLILAVAITTIIGITLYQISVGTWKAQTGINPPFLAAILVVLPVVILLVPWFNLYSWWFGIPVVPRSSKRQVDP